MYQNTNTPIWADDGQPANLSAAALDALAWLEWLRRDLAKNTTTDLDQARANLARCSTALRTQIHVALSKDDAPDDQANLPL